MVDHGEERLQSPCLGTLIIMYRELAPFRHVEACTSGLSLDIADYSSIVLLLRTIGSATIPEILIKHHCNRIWSSASSRHLPIDAFVYSTYTYACIVGFTCIGGVAKEATFYCLSLRCFHYYPGEDTEKVCRPAIPTKKFVLTETSSSSCHCPHKAQLLLSLRSIR